MNWRAERNENRAWLSRRAGPRWVGLAAAVVAAALVGPAAAASQQKTPPAPPGADSVPRPVADTAGVRPLSLEAAMRLAEDNSQQVLLARAALLRARGGEWQARSALLPQLNATAGYTRTLATEFSSVTSGASVDTTTGPQNCNGFTPNPTLPLAQRVDSLEHAVNCSTNGNPFSAFRNLPFGRTNQYNLGLSFSQSLFAGGRNWAQTRAAAATRRIAEIGLGTARAQVLLDVTQAYYDAALSDRLLAIAEATLAQAQTTLAQTRLARQVGEQPEFELLRAQVQYQNERPVVIQRRSDRDLAYMHLKQVLNLPQDTTLSLTTGLEDSTLAPVVQLVSAEMPAVGDTATAMRAPVRQAEQSLAASQAQQHVAGAERLPSISLVSQFGKVAYPESGLPSSLGQFRTNWTVGISVQLPIFDGGRILGDQLVARAGVLQARASLTQTRQLAAVDTRSALERLRAAEASYQASAGTVEQATKAYSIAELRYKEGISTQLELSDSRILLQQAEANRAQAARDLQVARVRAALLPYLPLGAGSAGTPAAATQGGVQAAGQAQQQQPTQSPAQGQQAQQTSAGGAAQAGRPTGGS